MSQFGTVNTVVMTVFVLATLAIGVFYGIRDRTGEKLLISRDMSVLPVSLSMMATFMSAILIIGTPSEIYFFGMQLEVGVFSIVVAGVLSAFVFLPVFHKLQLTSVYEYLGLRYGTRWMTGVTTTAFMIQNLLYTSVVLVAPAIVLSNVMEMDDGIAIAAIGLLGTVYTAFGGFRAVVWADVFQTFIMFAGIIAIILQGSVNVGGFSQIMDISREHGRLTMFTWKLDPLQRMNFWNTFFGLSVTWTSLLGVNQPAVQRSLSLPTYGKSVRMIAITVVLIVVIWTLATMSGLAIFATYAGCDPLASGLIKRQDEIVPHFVAEYFAHIPGLGGLFLACVLSGALSTVSSSLNALAAVTWEDFLKQSTCVARLEADARAWILRGLSLAFGVASILLAFLAKNMGSVVPVAIAVYGGVSGPILGVFCLAVLVPFSNPAGATAGLVSGVVLALWASFGASFSRLPPPGTLPTHINNCPFNTTDGMNLTLTSSNQSTQESHLNSDNILSPLDTLYSISYMLFSVLGFATTLFIGIVISLLTCGSKIEVDPEHVSPLVRCKLAKREQQSPRLAENHNTAFEPDFDTAHVVEASPPRFKSSSLALEWEEPPLTDRSQNGSSYK